MAGNSIGQAFRVTTFGESHGPALGAIVDGCPPGLALSEADLQQDLDRRRPGQSKYTTQRQEPDVVRILSGVFEGRTTGTSIGLVVRDLPTDRRFELRVVADDGSTQTACSWSATDLPEVSVVGATGTAVGAIDRLEVVDAADGEVYAVAHG